MSRSPSAHWLSGFHCFMSAARHLSFTRAAEELHLTQSAVSHKMRKLEEDVGFPLFHRLTRQLKLTHEGERLFSVLEKNLGEIDCEIRHIQNLELEGHLNLTTPPSLSLFWLVPRLSSFKERYPGITLHLRTRNDLVDFSRESVDLAIYYGDGQHQGLDAAFLMDEALFPVCSREYADNHRLWEGTHKLSSCDFLHDATPWPNSQVYSEWKVWADFCGIWDLDIRSGYSFDRCDCAVESAMNGLGIAMGRRRLVENKLSCGDLVAPFKNMCPSPHAYHVVTTRQNAKSARVIAFREWIMEVSSSGLERL